jgi:PAS domain S-box-containing protein
MILNNELNMGNQMLDIEKSKEELIKELNELKNENEFLKSFLMEDASDLSDIETALKRSKEHNFALLMAIPDIMFVQNKKGDYINYHAPESSLLYLQPDFFVGKNMRDVLPIEIAEEFEPIFEVALLTRKIQFYEYSMELPDGVHFFEARIIAYDDDRILSIVRDISEKKNSEIALKESEERFRTLLQEIHSVAIQAYGPDGTTKYWNKASEVVYGYTSEEAIGKNLIDLIIPPEMKEGVKQAMAYMAESGIPIPASELLLIRKDGTRVPVYSSHHIAHYPNKEQELFCLDIDLSDLKKAEEENTMLAAALKNINECISITDEENNIIFVNDKFLEVYGYTREEIIGENISKVRSNNNDDEVNLDKIFTETIKGGWNGEIINIKKDGTTFPIFLTTSFIERTDNRPRLLVGTFTDISERKKTEEVLLKLNNAIENSREVVFITDKEGIITYMNAEFTAMYGFEASEVIGKCTPRILKSGFNTKEGIEYMWSMLLSKQRLFGEYINKTKDGRFIHVEGSAEPILNETGEIIGYMGIHRDISERKKTENELIESKANLTSIIENTSDSIWAINTSYELIYINNVFYKYNQDLYGLSLTSGMNILEVFPSEMKDFWKTKYDLVFNDEHIIFEEKYEFPNSEIYVEVAMNPIKVDDKVIGASIFSRNITERKLAEKEILSLNSELEHRVEERTLELKSTLEKLEESYSELNLLNEQETKDSQRILKLNEELINSQLQLERALQTKDKFFSIIAHDLRNPFTGFLMLSEMLAKNYESLSLIELKQMGSSIFDAANAMFRLLDDLLQWSRIQMGNIPYNPEDLDIKELALNTQLSLRGNSDAKSIKIISNIDESVYVNCDRNMITSLLRNLTTNSIKFTPENGEIIIGIIKEYNNNNEVCIFVKDNGIGMSQEIISKLFNLDEHYTSPGTNKEIGTGLGLILCKEFIDKHNGKIWAESEIGKGSTFYFTLPKIN